MYLIAIDLTWCGNWKSDCETSCSELWLKWVAGWMCFTILMSSCLHNDPWFWSVSIPCVGLMQQRTHDWLKAQETCASIQTSYAFWDNYFISFSRLSLSVQCNFRKCFEAPLEDFTRWSKWPAAPYCRASAPQPPLLRCRALCARPLTHKY